MSPIRLAVVVSICAICVTASVEPGGRPARCHRPVIDSNAGDTYSNRPRSPSRRAVRRRRTTWPVACRRRRDPTGVTARRPSSRCHWLLTLAAAHPNESSNPSGAATQFAERAAPTPGSGRCRRRRAGAGPVSCPSVRRVLCGVSAASQVPGELSCRHAADSVLIRSHLVRAAAARGGDWRGICGGGGARLCVVPAAR